jgi:hypothetical protein
VLKLKGLTFLVKRVVSYSYSTLNGLAGQTSWPEPDTWNRFASPNTIQILHIQNSQQEAQKEKENDKFLLQTVPSI